jgi:osmoprotectant transport system ATP-binding protein
LIRAYSRDLRQKLPMIELQNVTKRFAGSVVVDSISLRFETGQTHVLIGPSGCGKSTLLRMIVGLVTPEAGAVLFDGEPVTPNSVAAIRRRVGYVIQEGGLFPHLTARQNAGLMPRFLGWPEKQTAARIDELTQLTQLTPAMLDRYPRQLSGGQRQRVSLMRALMLNPDALLLDEPMGNLDPMIRADLQADLRAIFRSLGKTVILVTHDLAEAGYLADHITLMRHGRIVQQGALRDLLEQPADDFTAKFTRAQRGLRLVES